MATGNRYLAWTGAALAVTGLVMSPAIAAVFSAGFDSQPVSLEARGGIGSFTPASADPRLTAGFELKAIKGLKNFRFTPAGADRDGKRAVTIAVRTRHSETEAVSVREAINNAQPGAASLSLVPTAYSLGVAKGWKKFALPVKSLKGVNLDLADFSKGSRKVSDDKPVKRSKFSPRLELDSKAPVGTAPRALDSMKDYSLDVGGSYSLTKNLNVTAGLRLSKERDRMAPLTDDRQDSQAVYVGTQFRF